MTETDRLTTVLNIAKRIIFTAIAILIPILIIYIGSSRMNTTANFDMVQLEDGWTISHADLYEENTSLSSASIGLINKGESVTMERSLSRITAPITCLAFRTILSTVDVYMDDELIYSYGYDYAESDKMLPKAYHYISLPDEYESSTLKIIITATEDGAFSGLGEFYLGDRIDIETMYVQNKRMPLFISIFLIMFSFILLLLTPFLFTSDHKDYSIFFNIIISFFMGTYILCYNDMIFFFTNNYYFGTILEYFSLFIIPFAAIGFLVTNNQRYNTIVTKIMLIVDIAFVTIVFVLHTTNTIHMNHFVIYMHLISLVEGLYVVIKITHNIIKDTRSDQSSHVLTSIQILALGIYILIICTIIDIVKFNIVKIFSDAGESTSSISLITMGALAFVICLLLNYFFHCIEHIGAVSIKKHLEGLAYTDELTGLANRAKCEQELVTISRTKGDYTIISLDLDNLKNVNDNHGHLEGDHLIIEFAELLKKAFKDSYLIGRMGGDEFIVILYNSESKAESLLSDLKLLIADKNSSDRNHIFRISASWGFAHRHELGEGKNASDVYMLADSRMYSMKNLHHTKTLNKLYQDIGNSVKGGEQS